MKINESLWQSHENLLNFRKIWWNYEDLPWTTSGRMYQTSVNQKWSDFWYIRPLTFQVVERIKSLIHSTTDVPSGPMYQKSDEHQWKSMKISWKVVECIRLPSEFWYIRPLTFQVVQCIKSGRMYQTSVRLQIHSTTDVPSGRMYQIWWKLMKIYENPCK